MNKSYHQQDKNEEGNYNITTPVRLPKPPSRTLKSTGSQVHQQYYMEKGDIDEQFVLEQHYYNSIGRKELLVIPNKTINK